LVLAKDKVTQYQDGIPARTVTQLSTNRARRRVTSWTWMTQRR